MTIFATGGLYLRNPRGGVENVSDMKAAGFNWLAWNEQDFPYASGAWQTIAERCATNGMAFFPWRYCWNEADVSQACSVARQYGGGKVILNLESEFHNYGLIRPAFVAEAAAGLDAALSLLPWPADNVNYDPMLHMPVHAGLFPQENETSKASRDCRSQYFKRGFKRVTFMRGVHHIEPPALPPQYLGACVYTADDCHLDYRKWGPKPLPPREFAYKGPGYGPNSPNGKPQSKKSKAWKALKIVMHEAGYGTFSSPDEAYNQGLVDAMKRFQTEHGLKATGDYGTGSYEAIKTLPWASPGEAYALTPQARDLMNAA